MVTLLAFVVLIGVLITVHEAGHFVVAKLAGVKVEVFSIGFGRAILSKRIGETEYRIAMFPVGGYVQMLGMNAETAIKAHPGAEAAGKAGHPDAGRDLLSKPPLVRIAIYLAGPAMNLVLPFLILLPVFTLGDRSSVVLDSAVGAVDQGLPAYAAGLRAGDRIVAIDGEPVEAFWQVAAAIRDYDADKGTLALTVARAGTTVDLAVKPKLVERTDRRVKFSKETWHIGFQPAFLAPDVAVTGPDTALARAGVRTFDRILAVGARPTPRFVDALDALSALAPGSTTPLEVERDAPLDAQFGFLVALRRHTLSYTSPENPSDISQVGLDHAGACVRSVAPDTAAGKALQVGDCILSVDGNPHSLGAFVQGRLANGPEQDKRLKVRRDGAELEVTIAPQKVVHTDPMAGDIEQWQLGLVLFGRPDGLVAPGLVPNTHRLSYAWDTAVEQVGYELSVTLNMVTGLFTGRVSPTQLGGPITIAAVAGQYAKAGIEHFLQLMIMLSLSIALLNLLPVPGLDGGHILVAAIELIVRRPLSPRARQGLQVVGAVMILLLVLFVTGNDLLRQWRMHAG